MKSTPKIQRRGYNLWDSIAVAGCMALLTVVLTPAILKARDQARAQQCKNRLKRMSGGLHNYHDTYRLFATGWISPQRDADSKPGYGWQFRLLPYLDQAQLYNLYNFHVPMPEPDERLSMALEIFQCPDDPAPPGKNLFRGGYGRSSYSGNLGDVAPIRWTDGRVESYWPGGVQTFHCVRLQGRGGAESVDMPNVDGAMTRTTNGIFGWNTRVGTRDVTDGTSHTIAIGERSQISGWGIWAGVGSNRFENDVATDVSYRSAINKSLTGFSSGHDGGAFFAMGDGAVRFLSENIDSKPDGGVFQHLGNRMDGAVIPENTFSDY